MTDATPHYYSLQSDTGERLTIMETLDGRVTISTDPTLADSVSISKAEFAKIVKLILGDHDHSMCSDIEVNSDYFANL